MNKAIERAVDAFKLDDFHFRLECGIDMLDVVREGIVSGEYSGQAENNALYGVVLYFIGLRDELGQMIKWAIKGKK